MSLRGWRSASVLRGIDPSRKSTPKAPPMAPRTASRHAEAVLDVGREHRQGAVVERVDQPGEAEGDERGGTAGAHGVAQRHRLGPDAGQQVVRKHDLLPGDLLGLAAGLLLVRASAASAGTRPRPVGSASSVDLRQDRPPGG